MQIKRLERRVEKPELGINVAADSQEYCVSLILELGYENYSSMGGRA